MRTGKLAQGVAVVLLSGLATVAGAQLKLESVPGNLMLPAAWNQVETPRPAAGTTPDAKRYPDFAAARWWLSSSLYVEPARIVEGRYTRPRFNLGVPSESTRNLLRASGLDARDCMLPMVRARVNLSGSDNNGAIWLFMRCTLD